MTLFTLRLLWERTEEEMFSPDDLGVFSLKKIFDFHLRGAQESVSSPKSEETVHLHDQD